MSAAREVVAHAIANHDTFEPPSMPDADDYGKADAVLAALREHWTSDASINRLVGEPYMDWDQTYAIVAALFEFFDGDPRSSAGSRSWSPSSLIGDDDD